MEKIEETIDKICKSRIWEFIFVLIYPMLILFITENIGEMYLNDKIIRIKVMFESEAYLLILNTIIAPYIFIILISLFFRSISKNSFISNSDNCYNVIIYGFLYNRNFIRFSKKSIHLFGVMLTSLL